MELSRRYATSNQMESVCQVKETTMDKVITLSEEEAVGCIKYFIYEPHEAASAFEMFTKICAMYKL